VRAHLLAFRTFFVSVIGHWSAYITGGAAAALVFLYEHLAGRNVSLKTLAAFVGTFLLVSFYQTWRDEHRQVEVERLRLEQLEERVRARLTVVLDDCCMSSSAVCVGVANLSLTSVHDVRVYVDHVGTGFKGVALSWANVEWDQPLTIHPASGEQHHHTRSLVSGGLVGDGVPMFLLWFARGNHRIEPGIHHLTLHLEGEDITATTASVEIVCGPGTTVKARMLSPG
jgi:hypothetical protein